ncbi:MAG: hypothetical protein IKW84_09605 [Bacteroidaceae bacterium]|nr:hypothetical protein [Bacteroidaceae bacterium]
MEQACVTLREAERTAIVNVETGLVERFTQNAGRTITAHAAALAYDLFEGHTYYVHNLLHNTFASADADKVVNEADINQTLTEILDEKGRAFASIMNQLNYQQKETLVAIAKEGKATGVTSVAFVKKHPLKSPSSVQYAISTLLDKQLLTYDDQGRTKIYSLSDRFLSMWLSRTY